MGVSQYAVRGRDRAGPGERVVNQVDYMRGAWDYARMSSSSSLSEKTILITGANSGIGKATAAALVARGATVIMAARDLEKGKAAAASIPEGTGRLVCKQLDLASFASIRRFAAEVLAEHERLHVVINNAGLMLSERRQTEEGLEQTLGINHVGHFLLTDLLLDRIKASAPARIINVSSKAHTQAGGLDFDDPMGEKSYDGFKAYSRSKLANVLFTQELAERLEGSGVTVNSLHPGVVASGFARDGDAQGFFGAFFKWGARFLRSPQSGAATSIFLATDPDVASVSGQYFADCKPKKVAKAARDKDAQRRLWQMTERWVASGTA